MNDFLEALLYASIGTFSAFVFVFCIVLPWFVGVIILINILRVC